MPNLNAHSLPLRNVNNHTAPPSGSSPPHPVITLLSDFGTQDAFVGTMKGVILAKCPSAQLVDLTHAVEPADIVGGALLLGAAAAYFPVGTVHLAVVDPGVGGTRRPIVIAAGEHCFVGPDNGLLWPAASAAGDPVIYELREVRFRLSQVSATFHGRDIFAPAAALLAAGEAPSAMGPLCESPCSLTLPVPVTGSGRVAGEVLWVDRFGNAITNLTPELVRRCAGEPFRMNAAEFSVVGPVSHYGAVPVGQPVVVLGSMGYYEIALNRGHAAEAFGLVRGTPVVVEPVSNGGF
jgi:S-adenosyl-L-methionine hydrolase (adenosine-forming)